MNVILQKIATYLLENKREGQRYTARGSWECSVRLGSSVLCRRSRVKCRSSRVQKRRLQHLLFIFCITYLLLKIFFPSTLVQGSGSPRDSWGFWVLLPFDHPRHLNPEYPRPAGGSPLCKILGKNQESSCRLLRRNRQSWIFPMRIRLF